MRTSYGHETLQLNTHAKTRLRINIACSRITINLAPTKQAFTENKHVRAI